MEEFMEYLPFLLPLIIIQFVLQIVALVHLLKHPNYRFGNKIFWIIFILLGQMIGPIVYFVFGREE